MRNAATLTVLLALAAGARADTIEYAYGGKRTGTLEEVTMLVDGVRSMFTRDLVQTITLGEDGSDAVVLEGGTKREGKVLAVRFRMTDKVLTLTRQTVRSVTLDGKVAPAKEPEPEETSKTDVETKPVEELTPEELALRKALGKNKALYRAAVEKAEAMRKEDVDELKDQYLKDCEKVVKDMDRAKESVKQALRRRRDAEERWREYQRRDVGRSRYNRNFDPSRYTDQIQRDTNAYNAAKRQKSRLKKTIDKAMDKFDKDLTSRKKRVLYSYKLHRKALLDAEELTEEKMKERYFACLDLRKKLTSSKKGTPGKSGTFDGERKPNPFDEMMKDRAKKKR